MVRVDGGAFQGKMVEGEENRANDRPYGSTTVKDWPDEGDDTEETKTERPETQKVTDRPREDRILKRKVLRIVKYFREIKGQRGLSSSHWTYQLGDPRRPSANWAKWCKTVSDDVWHFSDT